jgi:hypothetical protein
MNAPFPASVDALPGASRAVAPTAAEAALDGEERLDFAERSPAASSVWLDKT